MKEKKEVCESKVTELVRWTFFSAKRAKVVFMCFREYISMNNRVNSLRSKGTLLWHCTDWNIVQEILNIHIHTLAHAHNFILFFKSTAAITSPNLVVLAKLGNIYIHCLLSSFLTSVAWIIF